MFNYINQCFLLIYVKIINANNWIETIVKIHVFMCLDDISILHSGGIVGVTTWLHAGVSSIEAGPRGLFIAIIKLLCKYLLFSQIEYMC